ncbi:MAG: hypothetical protein CVU05_01015 [Bacteroidetes bacterium HGW-Bacteroidetes-21]|jgi:transglutaminase/protease-like cytokinesis protein 3|nr:MAG: hypothetical protein CVU05_01015 [Bacteroidetes bacterium HGW-Bacteroidetes-21]
MYKVFRLFIIFVLIFGNMAIVNAQKKKKTKEFEVVDNIALSIPDSLTSSVSDIAGYFNGNFSSEKDKYRAIFIWVATNVKYDVVNMFAANFYENTDDVIKKVLSTKKGVCLHYAELFNAIANKAGLKSYVVSGFTKQVNYVDYIAHVWCVVKADSLWSFCDPTWGSGYVESKRFVPKIDNSYFNAKPEFMIQSHMPFDPMWQFLNRPLPYQEFCATVVLTHSERLYFNYLDTLKAYESQNALDRATSLTARMEKGGEVNSLVFDRLNHNKREVEYLRNKIASEKYNSLSNMYNESINNYNLYIDYKNKQFIPEKPDSEIKQMIDNIDSTLNVMVNELNVIKSPDQNFATSVSQLIQSAQRMQSKVSEQRDFLDKYINTPKKNRKALFYKKSN